MNMSRISKLIQSISLSQQQKCNAFMYIKLRYMKQAKLKNQFRLLLSLIIILTQAKHLSQMPNHDGSCTISRNLTTKILNHNRNMQMLNNQDNLHNFDISYEIIQHLQNQQGQSRQAKQTFITRAFTVSASYFKRVILVSSLTNAQKQAKDDTICGGNKIDTKYQQTNHNLFEDLMVFLLFKTDDFSKLEGSSEVCQFSRRPIYAAMYLNTASFPKLFIDESFAKIVLIIVFFYLMKLHQGFHILGFNSDLYKFYTFSDVLKTSPYDSQRQMIVTPNVVNWVMNYFSCSNLTLGALLQNDGFLANKNEHWQRAIFYDQIMTGYSVSKSHRLTGLTLSLIKDTNFYQFVDIGYAWQPIYGKNKKCDFAFGIFNDQYPQFCNPSQFNITTCDIYHEFLAECPKVEQLTQKQKKSITSPIYFCQGTTQHINANRVASFERYSDESSCFQIEQNDSNKSGYCLQSSCNRNTKTITFNINNLQYNCQTDGQQIIIKTYNLKIFCPSYRNFCRAKTCANWCGSNGICINSACVINNCNIIQDFTKNCQFCVTFEDGTSECQKCQRGYQLVDKNCILSKRKGFSEQGWIVVDNETDIIVGNCPNNCKICQSKHICTTCRDYTITGSLILPCQLCPPGMYINSNGLCKTCSTDCLQCAGNQNICTKCKDNQGLVSYECFQCSTLTKWFLNAQDICQKCHQKCKTCSERAQNCISCYPQFYIQNNVCLPCLNNSHKFLDENGVCKQCDQNCQTCQKTSTNCKTCGDWKWLMATQTCSLCQYGEYLDQLSQTCQKCAQFCAVCFKDSQDCVTQLVVYNYGGAQWQRERILCAQGCKYCNKNNNELKLQCHIPMPQYYLDTQNLSPMPCIGNCVSCSTSNNCDQCQQSYVYNGSVCLKCHQSCLTCQASNINVCVDCYNTFFKNKTTGYCQKISILNCESINSNGQCMECVLGFAIIKQINKCFQCPYYCLRCNATNISQCLQCGLGQFSVLGKCQQCINHCLKCINSYSCDQCMPGYHFTTVKGCERICQLPCWQCDWDTPRKCISCYEGFELDAQTQSCIPKDYSVDPINCTFGQRYLNGNCLKCKLDNCLQCKNSQSNTQLCRFCQNGYFANLEGKCQKCAEGCRYCKNKQICNQCQAGYTRRILPGKKQLSKHGCFACLKPCLTCLGSPNICRKCQDGYTLLGYDCITEDFLSYSVTLATDYDTFQAQRKQVEVIKAILLAVNPSFTQLKYHNINSVSKGSVILNGSIHNSQVNSSEICNQQINLVNALQVGKTISGYKIESSSVVSNLTNSYACETVVEQSSNSLLLILLLSIPFGIITIIVVLCVVLCVYRNYYSDTKINVDEIETEKQRFSETVQFYQNKSKI